MSDSMQSRSGYAICSDCEDVMDCQQATAVKAYYSEYKQYFTFYVCPECAEERAEARKQNAEHNRMIDEMKKREEAEKAAVAAKSKEAFEGIVNNDGPEALSQPLPAITELPIRKTESEEEAPPKVAASSL